MSNFFDRQETARRNTLQLVSIYGATVALLILGLYVSAVLPLEGALVFRPWVLGGLVVTLGICLLVTYGQQRAKLRRGGHVVAQRLNGRRLSPTTTSERELANVVEEMAIAAGTPAPPIYVLPERGINAFSAGLTQDDAVIGVTRGALDHLNRAELQGVVAHEFSHILNGDMALNLRLMSWTRGLERIRDLGKGIAWAIIVLPIRLPQIAFQLVRNVKDGVKKLASGGIGGIVILAVTVYFFGGTFFMLLFLLMGGAVGSGYAIARFAVLQYVLLLGAAGTGLGGIAFLGAQLIKAQVSREREFLADAAAVQFTRNPSGIGRALLKQGDCEHSGHVQARGVEAVRHLFFGEPVEASGGIAGWLPTPLWLSTHPPIEERIRQIDPSILDESPSLKQETQSGAPSNGPFSPDTLIERAGTLAPEMLVQAEALHASLPNDLLRAAHEPLGAMSVSYALMLDSAESMRCRQLDLLWEREQPPVYDETKRLYDQVAGLDRSLRLPLVEIAAPSLRKLSADQQDRLHDTIRALAEVDDRLTLFEFALETIVRHYLDHNDHRENDSGTLPAAAVQEDIVVLLSGLAQAGHADTSAARAAFEDGYAPLADAHGFDTAEPTAPPPDALDSALDRLARTPLPYRNEILQAGARCAMADDAVEPSEETLLRAVAIALGVPLPLSVSKEALSSVATSEAPDKA